MNLFLYLHMCVYICIYNVYILHIMYISPIHSVSLVTVTNTDAELIVGCHGEHENISSSACFKVRLLPQWLGVLSADSFQMSVPLPQLQRSLLSKVMPFLGHHIQYMISWGYKGSATLSRGGITLIYHICSRVPCGGLIRSVITAGRLSLPNPTSPSAYQRCWS